MTADKWAAIEQLIREMTPEEKRDLGSRLLQPIRPTSIPTDSELAARQKAAGIQLFRDLKQLPIPEGSKPVSAADIDEIIYGEHP